MRAMIGYLRLYVCVCVFGVYAVCGMIKDTMLESAGGGR